MGPVAREARSAGDPKRWRERMERGLAAQAGGPDRFRWPPEGRPAGVEDRGGYPGRSRTASSGSPARRRRCGKAPTRPPDASFRKTSRAERLSFAETVFLFNHPGEGPDAPPCLPFDLPRLRGGARPHDFVIPGQRARRGEADPGRNSAAPKAAWPPGRPRFSSQFRPDFLYVAGLGADRIRVLKTVRSRRPRRRLHRPSERAFHRPNI